MNLCVGPLILIYTFYHCLCILATCAGVYLSHNGNIIVPGSNIFATDIGSSLDRQLVCTTDRMPCCQNPDQTSKWYFPDGTPLGNISGGPGTFYSNRDNNGNINLIRSYDAIHPQTGNFCCGIQDATGMDKKLCVNIGEHIIMLYTT